MRSKASAGQMQKLQRQCQDKAAHTEQAEHAKRERRERERERKRGRDRQETEWPWISRLLCHKDRKALASMRAPAQTSTSEKLVREGSIDQASAWTILPT